MGEVAAPHRLRRIEPRVVAQGHERVLQRRALPRVGVDVAGRHARHPELRRQLGQPPVARAVVALERALELDPQVVAPEGGEQAAKRRPVVHAAGGAAAQADQPGRVLLHELERHGRRDLDPPRRGPIPRVRVRAREDPAQVAPALPVGHQQRQMAAHLVVAHAGRAIGLHHVDLRPVDRPQPERRGRLRELHRARDRVVVGQGEGVVPQLDRSRHQLLRQRRAVEEREGGVAVELGVQDEHMFA